jgi:hypothetical protein
MKKLSSDKKDNMKSYKLTLIYGFLIWIIVFAVAMAIFPIRNSNRALFESIMPVALTICVVIFGNLYFRKLETSFVKEGVTLGIVWLLINLIIDLALFMQGPMKMAFADYISDIGLTYLLIPAITIGFGYVRNLSK